MDPRELYNNIFNVLKNDGVHNTMVEQKSRCIRVNYANDFHLDIMPGKVINRTTNEIIVPDKKLNGWYHHSNPIGFAEWFEEQAKKQILLEMNSQRSFSSNVEKITDQEIAERLEPLRRAVQLIKRYRDIYCDKYKKEPVRSIVICTLMGLTKNYAGSTLQIINNFCKYVNALIETHPTEPFVVKNPVVDEILTEKWNEGNNYQDFIEMMQSLTKDVEELQSFYINSDTNDLVKKMFGENITNIVIKSFAKQLNESRDSGNISVNSKGMISTNKTGLPVKKNTFYGEK